MATKRLKLGRAWDSEFRGWVDELRLGRRQFKPPAASGGSSNWTGAALKASAPAGYPGQGSKADVRARLYAMTRRSKQVMVKITPGKNTTFKATAKHMQYISKDGTETVIDQDGNPYKGKEAVADLAWLWKHEGPLMPEESKHRMAFNIMFSMPEHTNERAVFEAVRAVAQREFAGHQWAMAQHFDEPQVHCHVIVKAEAFDGRRLNPRKEDLRRWRELFAYELRERGVEAEATSRAQRHHREKINTPWAATRLQERGEETNPKPAQPDPAKAANWTQRSEVTMTSYDRITAALGQSDDMEDRELAVRLRQFAAESQQRNGPDRAARGEREPQLERG